MTGRWSLHLFDWEKYDRLAPLLREAVATDLFSDIGDEEADSLLEDISEDAAPEEICNALIMELCVAAESATFDSGLPEIILWLRRQRSAEDAADTLAALISGGRNIEPWLACDEGLVGLLTREETQDVGQALDSFYNSCKPAEKSPTLFAGAMTRLFSTTNPADENIQDLLEIVREASERGSGLAAILER